MKNKNLTTVIRPDSNLASVLRGVHNIMNRQYDYFTVITGAEGKGKSRGIFLNVIDFWYKGILNKEPPKECFGVDVKMFITALRNAKPLDFAGLDEGGDALDSADHGKRFQKMLYQAYTIIRERRVFSVVVLPSLFELSPRFRRRRVKMLIHVVKRIDNNCKLCGCDFVGNKCFDCGSNNYNRGYIKYKIFFRNSINQILERNAYKIIKSINVGVAADVEGICFQYDGELASYYGELKKEKANNKLEDLENEFTKNEESEGFVDKEHKHTWRHNRREAIWICRSCGFETDNNPFETDTQHQPITTINKCELEGGFDTK